MTPDQLWEEYQRKKRKEEQWAEQRKRKIMPLVWRQYYQFRFDVETFEREQAEENLTPFIRELGNNVIWKKKVTVKTNVKYKKIFLRRLAAKQKLRHHE
jgi:hypothetical protein